MGDENKLLQKERDFIPLPNLMRMAKDIYRNKEVTMEFIVIKLMNICLIIVSTLILRLLKQQLFSENKS